MNDRTSRHQHNNRPVPVAVARVGSSRKVGGLGHHRIQRQLFRVRRSPPNYEK
jgi:hypothetical protein